MALAADRAVKVSWLPVPVGDVDHYLLYRGRDDAEVADAFCGSRFGTSYGGTFGMLDSGSLREVVDRATPRP